ncbi:MAG: Uncharacterised protein [Halieaceae bacterium]|nr:MAG: Uncharacterised protein [Halieaceae bacterium]
MGAFLAWKSYLASDLIRHWAHETAVIARHVDGMNKKDSLEARSETSTAAASWEKNNNEV